MPRETKEEEGDIMCVRVRDRAVPVAYDCPSLSFTRALLGAHALNGNGTNKKEHLSIPVWA